jgi:hypothetical protein
MHRDSNDLCSDDKRPRKLADISDRRECSKKISTAEGKMSFF